MKQESKTTNSFIRELLCRVSQSPDSKDQCQICLPLGVTDLETAITLSSELLLVC